MNYLNGNVQVHLYSDGSKERIFEGLAKPIHPESIDVKITNACDGGCNFCHEKSVPGGQHGDLERLAGVLSALPAGVEIALGGGNPLSHPGLLPFLERIKNQGLVANITVNQKHLKKYRDMLLDMIGRELVKGVGISYTSARYLPDIQPILDATDNVVFHLIMGVNKVEDVEELSKFCKNRACKVLVLGYKQYGFGIEYYTNRVDENRYEWYTRLAGNFKRKNLILSFDNLAIEQLKLRRYFSDKAWEEFYMGDDFVFTMYIDGVEGKFAPTSCSNDRQSFERTNLLKYFQENRRGA